MDIFNRRTILEPMSRVEKLNVSYIHRGLLVVNKTMVALKDLDMAFTNLKIGDTFV